MEVELQNVIFPKKGLCEDVNLYYREENSNNQNFYNGPIIFNNKQSISFDTYFNSLSLAKWFTYSKIKEVSLKISFKGSFLVQCFQVFLNENNQVEYKNIFEKEITSNNKQTIFIAYPLENTKGMLSFRLKCLKGGSVFYGASYVSSPKKEEFNNVNLAVGICTYNRQEYVKNNIKILEDIKFCNNKKLQIFVSDNAKNLNLGKEQNNVHVFKNKNVGGSGGFTRCMIEAINYNLTNKEKLSHLILMDDDIKLDAESVIRTFNLLTLLKDEYKSNFVGGAMLKIDKPGTEFCNGEFWNGKNCENPVINKNKDKKLDNILEILDNERIIETNFQGWWFCAIPMEVISFNNLPMPFFIKYDDIEYGVRNNRPIIMINGINAWHESFESKYSVKNEYYTTRNLMITQVMHKINVSKKQVCLFAKNHLLYALSNYKYLEFEYFCQAINDFLKGYQFFSKIDLENFHKQNLNKDYEKLDVMKSPVKITDEKYYSDINNNPKKSMFFKLFQILTINGLLLPARGYSILNVMGGTSRQTFRKRFVVLFEKENNKVIILKRSFKKAIYCYKSYKKLIKNLKKNYDFACKSFSENWKDLVNINYWKKQLELK